MRRLPSLLLVVAVTSCSSAPEPEARFVHAVLPGIPVETGRTASSPTDPGAALSALLETAAQLPGTDDRPDFIVITGLPRTAVPAAGRDSVVAGVVQTLRRSPTRRVLLVPNG